jgi:hypothetical protein
VRKKGNKNKELVATERTLANKLPQFLSVTVFLRKRFIERAEQTPIQKLASL